MIIIGIDPGVTGAVASISQSQVRVTDTPVDVVTRGRKSKLEFLPGEMANLLSMYADPEGSPHVFIEQVSAMPGQGVTSMFGFGKGYGIWIGILAALGIPYTFVTPQAWKKVIMAGKGDKDAARGVAQSLFPSMVSQLSRKKDIGRADALLIAEYGRRTMKGGK